MASTVSLSYFINEFIALINQLVDIELINQIIYWSILSTISLNDAINCHRIISSTDSSNYYINHFIELLLHQHRLFHEVDDQRIAIFHETFRLNLYFIGYFPAQCHQLFIRSNSLHTALIIDCIIYKYKRNIYVDCTLLSTLQRNSCSFARLAWHKNTRRGKRPVHIEQLPAACICVCMCLITCVCVCVCTWPVKYWSWRLQLAGEIVPLYIDRVRKEAAHLVGLCNDPEKHTHPHTHTRLPTLHRGFTHTEITRAHVFTFLGTLEIWM